MPKTVERDVSGKRFFPPVILGGSEGTVRKSETPGRARGRAGAGTGAGGALGVP